MNVQRGDVGLPKGDADSGSLEAYISAIDSLPAEERRLTYRECAKFLLIRYLIERNLAEGPLHEEECRPCDDACVAENADGICYLFYVRGNVWDVILSRKEDSKRAIEENPELLSDPNQCLMDFKKAARINLRNSDFRK